MATTDRRSGITGDLAMKAACYVASTTNITLGSTQVIDGIAVGSTGERILVKNQTDAKENGIYVASGASWSRSKDADGTNDLIPGSLVYVDRGTTHGRTFWAFNSSSTALSITVNDSTGDNIVLNQVTEALGSGALTTLGDILSHNGSASVRVGVGATNTVLQSVGSTVAWGLIGSTNIVAAGLSSSGIGSSAITSTHISSSAITTAKIAAGAVTGPKVAIAGQSIGAIPYFDGSTWTTLAPGSSGTVLQSVGSTIPVWTLVPTVVARNMAQNEIVNSTVESTMLSYTVPAGLLGTNRALRVYMAGEYENSSGSGKTLRVKVKYGSTTLFDDITGSFISNANTRTWCMSFTLSAGDSATVQRLTGYSNITSPNAPTAGYGLFIDSGGNASNFGGSAAEDSSGALALEITFIHGGASTATTIRADQRYVELLP